MALIISRVPQDGLPPHDYYVRVVVEQRKTRLNPDAPPVEQREGLPEAARELAISTKMEFGLTLEDTGGRDPHRFPRPGDDDLLKEKAEEAGHEARSFAIHRLAKDTMREQRSVAILLFYVSDPGPSLQAQPVFSEQVLFDFDGSPDAPHVDEQAYLAVKADPRFADARSA